MSCARAGPPPNATSPATATPASIAFDRSRHFHLPGAARRPSGSAGGADGRVAACGPVNRFRGWSRATAIGHIGRQAGRTIMDKRQLGRSDLGWRRSASAATCSAGPPTRQPRSACSTGSSRPGSTSSTRPTSTRPGSPAIAAASPRRSSATGCSQRGCRDKVVIATKVGSDMGAGPQGPVAGLDPRGGRGFAAAAADRPDRPLPGALRRPGDAARGDARRLRRADRGGQGAGDRRLQLQRRRGCARRWPISARGRAAALRDACSPSTISTTAPATRPSSSRCAASTGWA